MQRRKLTKPVDSGANVTTGLSENDLADVGNRVNFRMSVLELAHLIGSVCNCRDCGGELELHARTRESKTHWEAKERPLTSPENGDRDQDDETRNETQSVECGRERQYSQTDLRLHHQDGSSHPTDL